MAEFTISPRVVRQKAASFGTYSTKMSAYQRRISSVKCSIRNTSAGSVTGALTKIENQAGVQAKTFHTMQTVLNSCVTQYENAEKRSAGKSISVLQLIIQDQFDKNSPGWKLFDSETTKSWGKAEWEGALAQYRGDGKAQEYILKAAASAGISLSGPGYKDSSAFKEIKRGEGKLGDHWVREKDGQYSIPELTKYASKKGTVAEVKAEAKAETSLYGKSWGNENVSAEVVVGKAEVHASAKAGLYGYDKDGKKVLAPAVEATVGGSVCAANLQAQAHVGDDMFGVGVDGEVSVGKASAEATASAALFGKDGKLNPQLKASASAEAIAAEAKGSAHVNIAGVEGKVNGSVNFGVGAHADIGLVDGKLKCDIGASLGVGASVGFEIDTKALVDTAVSTAKALWPGNWKLW